MQRNPSRMGHAVAGAQERAVAVHQRRWQQAFGEQALIAVHVGQNAVEQGGALDDARFDLRPFVGGDDLRQQVQVPGAVGPLRVGVDVVGDAIFTHLAVDGFDPLAHQFAGRRGQLAEHPIPMGARGQWRLEHFVVAALGVRVVREELDGHGRIEGSLRGGRRA